ncbi:MAG: F0F1 ATP synthase subunit A [Treponema sp.]|nr:F0F1 ATP synthase subunit A [Treponema sp.]
MDVLDIQTVFFLTIAGRTVPITETVIVSWVAMLIIIAGSLLLTRRLRLVPQGPQVILETAVEFLNKFAKNHFGPFAKYLGPYMGSLFLFIFVSTLIGVLTPVDVHAFGREFIPPIVIRPATRDINVTAALAVISILLVLVCGFAARGLKGWFKHLLHPLPMMLPFNIMEYFTRILSLSLRLFGNVLGSVVMMHLIAGVFPLMLPMIFALYFEFFHAAIQATIFVFLTSLYISEAVKLNE